MKIKMFSLKMHLLILTGLLYSQISFSQTWSEFPNDLVEDWHLGFYIANNDTFYTCSNIGKVYRSSNGGENWEEVHFQVGTILQNIHFPTNDVGYISGSNDKYLKSTDGGVTWNVYYIDPEGSTADVHFITEDIGFLAGSGMDGAQIWKTINGGSSWVMTVVDGYGLQDISFTTDMIGYTCSNNYVIKTDDQGETWNTIYTAPDDVIIYSIDFYDEAHGIAVGGNGQHIAKTEDGGITWDIITPPVDLTGTVLQDVDYFDENSIYTVGNGGYILFSNDGGDSWDSQLITGWGSPTFNNFDFTPDGARFVHGSHIYTDDISCDLSIAFSDDTLCEGTALLLDASGALEISWNMGVEDGLAFYPPVGTTTYTVTGTSGEDCVDVDSVEITVLPAPLPEIIHTGDILSTSAIGAIYQWYLDDVAIPDSDAAELTIIENGNYYLEITYENGCVRNSEVISILDLSIGSFNNALQVNVYPNPTQGTITINTDGSFTKSLRYNLTNELGQTFLNGNLTQAITSIDLSNYDKGIYILTLRTESGTQKVKIIHL